MQDLKQLIEQAQIDFAQATNSSQLEQAKAQYLGKSGKITQQLKRLGSLEAHLRREVGEIINQAKNTIEAALEQRRAQIQEQQLKKRLIAERIDVSLPGRRRGFGGVHPVSLTLERIEHLFSSIGFNVVLGPTSSL